MRHIIIGDVHGCLHQTNDLLKEVEFSSKDHLILLGDLVDRGPKSPETVKYLYGLSLSHKVTLIRGNHEHKHIITMFYDMTFPNHDEIISCQKHLTDEERKWLFSGSLFYRNRKENFICIHGGIPSDMNKLPWPKFDDNSGPVSQNWARKLMFLRKENDEYWAENYDGRFGFAFFGHSVFEEPRRWKNALGLDTGCFSSGKLSAAVVESGSIETISVSRRET